MTVPPDLPPDDKRLAAIASGSLDGIEQALAEGADVNCYDGGALENAIWTGGGPAVGAAIVRRLLAAGARIVADESGSALHSAAEKGWIEALKALLQADCRLALNSFDEISRTPLACAADKGQLEAAKLLLAAGADVNAHDEARAGGTALILAVEKADLPMVKLLIEHGADPTVPGWMQITALDKAREWPKWKRHPEMKTLYALLEKAALRPR